VADKQNNKAEEVEKKAAENVEIVEEEKPEPGTYVVKQKPKLDDDVKRALSIRNKATERRPEFKRQEWFRYKRLGESWRKPRGLHSKMRTNKKYRPNVASAGYRGPKKARGLHPSGFREVLVHNVKQLDGLDPGLQAVRIGRTVGSLKRDAIEERAEELGLRVLNRRG